MGMTTITVSDGQKPTEEQIKRIRAAAKESRKHPETDDPDCLPSSPEALREFAAMARSLRKRKPSPVVSIRLKPDVLQKYKALGKGYTGAISDVLTYAVENPEFLAKAVKA